MIMPLRAILPYLMQKAGYFEQAGLQHRMDIFKVVLVPSEQSAKQIDDNSCGVFCLSFLDSIIRGIPISSITQSIVDKLKTDYALEVFLNNIEPAEDIQEFEQLRFLLVQSLLYTIYISLICIELPIIINFITIEIFSKIQQSFICNKRIKTYPLPNKTFIIFIIINIFIITDNISYHIIYPMPKISQTFRITYKITNYTNYTDS